VGWGSGVGWGLSKPEQVFGEVGCGSVMRGLGGEWGQNGGCATGHYRCKWRSRNDVFVFVFVGVGDSVDHLKVRNQIVHVFYVFGPLIAGILIFWAIRKPSVIRKLTPTFPIAVH